MEELSSCERQYGSQSQKNVLWPFTEKVQLVSDLDQLFSIIIMIIMIIITIIIISHLSMSGPGSFFKMEITK